MFKLNINVSFCSVEVSFHDFEIRAPHHKVAAGKSDPRTQQQISQKLQITPSMGINFMLLWYPKPREIHMVSIKQHEKPSKSLNFLCDQFLINAWLEIV